MQQKADEVTSFSGPLAETTRATLQMTDSDGNVFPADVYTVVNLADDPELREDIVDGTLNTVESPDREETWRPAVPLRVHDPDERRYVLVLPEALAHRELELRRDLLDELANVSGMVPAYVRRFHTVVGGGGLERVEQLADASTAPAETAEPGSKDAGEAAPSGEVGDAELEEAWSELEEERQELDVRREQLDSVQERIDRERRQMDEVEQQLADERDELESMRAQLDEERQELEARKLQLEERERRAEQPTSVNDEVTQVVTDDQFVSISEQTSGDQGGFDDLAAESRVEPVGRDTPTQVVQEESGVRARPGDVVVERIDSQTLPATFNEEAADGDDFFVDVVDGTVLAVCRVDSERADLLTQTPPAFFVQYHLLEEFPMAALLLAQLDEDAQPQASFGWPLDISRETHRMVLNRLSEETYLEVAVYDEEDGLAGVFAVDAPLEENVEWIRTRVEDRMSDPDLPSGTFEEAVRTYLADDFDRLGKMRHNFDREAFRELDTPSQVKLAAGVVGYWSTDEVFEYLVSNRSYPLERFRALQREVVDAALEEGIYLNEPLRELAIEMGLVTDEVELIERLLANFAEVSVRLKANDLEPMDEWDNWDALIEFAQDVGVTPDPDVLELAEASLKRARDFQETREAEAAAESAEREAPGADAEDAEGDREGGEPAGDGAASDQSAEDFLEDPGAVDVDTLVVSKRSESTGVTYYLPDEAVLDTFDDLADMPREDLEKLLKDPNGRLEAAQMLIERFDGSVVSDVMDAAEKMSAPEVTALARFLETKAEGLEAELVRTVEAEGPSATFVAARALAHIKSTSAIPTLIEAYRDTDRNLNRRAVARTLANYGEKLLPPLTRSIQQDGVDEHVVLLLQYLEEADEGILDNMATDRHKDVREAVEQAREGLR